MGLKIRSLVSALKVNSRLFSTCNRLNQFNEPLSGHSMARAGGIASMMRLPVQETAEGLHACFVGVPLDIGTSNRSGTRYGPRQIRAESALIRKCNNATGASPFDSFQVADVGDVNINLYNLPKACEDIKKHFLKIINTGCIPLALGGDHTMTYPILQAIKEKHGPVGMVHIDAHSDTNDLMLGEKIAHGTPFRRAIEEGCLDGKRVIQIGLRGSGYSTSDYDWAKQQGFRCVQAHECWHKSLTPLMEEVRQMMGDKPVYISFDIDGLDPCYAPGTGTPEVGGLTVIQGLEILRGCRGLNVIGGDLVEVSPPYDTTGTTALVGANMLFEMLCVLPGVIYK
ncbi:guanidinobutyrase-like [Mytilus galloprovincialis]|uniref:guanidinobutyrase-like n=1 Tax=Mytilus galloprovincialis TaxID=29158 RepID=UPI003F7CC8BA